MKPDVMTRMVEIMATAHVHLFTSIGRVMRAARAASRVVVIIEPTRPQLIGARKGIGTGVKSDIWTASSFASEPLSWSQQPGEQKISERPTSY